MRVCGRGEGGNDRSGGGGGDMLFNSNAEPFLPPADLEVCLLLLFFVRLLVVLGCFFFCFVLFVFLFFGLGFVCSFCLFVVVIVSGWLGI